MLKVYLAGEIHTNWREEIIENCKKENLDIKFLSPVTDHPSSDDCGVEILGPEEKNFWIKFSVWLVQGGVTSMTLKLIGMFILMSLIF